MINKKLAPHFRLTLRFHHVCFVCVGVLFPPCLAMGESCIPTCWVSVMLKLFCLSLAFETKTKKVQMKWTETGQTIAITPQLDECCTSWPMLRHEMIRKTIVRDLCTFIDVRGGPGWLFFALMMFYEVIHMTILTHNSLGVGKCWISFRFWGPEVKWTANKRANRFSVRII